jgi:iron complex transport system ATP-binding protein
VSEGHTQRWALEARNVVVRRRDRTVLDGVNLTIRAGDCVSIIGPNGAGKTTLLLTLLGLLRPANGQLLLDGRDLYAIPARRRGRFASYVPQLLDRIPGFRLVDVVAAARYAHVPPFSPLQPEDRRAVSEALAACGLTTLAEQPINAVSGGERQKALLAAAIAQDPQVMFLDEPNASLDPAYQIELLAMLHGWRTAGRALVFVSHELRLPGALGGRVIGLRDGRIVIDARAADALQPEVLYRVFGAPFDLAVLPDGERIAIPRAAHAAVRLPDSAR